MGRLVHDFINGCYYENSLTPYEHECVDRKKAALCRGQQYILIKICESKLRGEKGSCELTRYYYGADQETAPCNVVILSKNEYIKNEENGSYYRKYDENRSYMFIEVEVNIKLEADKVERIHESFLCTVKGKEELYTEEEFREKFIPKQL